MALRFTSEMKIPIKKHDNCFEMSSSPLYAEEQNKKLLQKVLFFRVLSLSGDAGAPMRIQKW